MVKTGLLVRLQAKPGKEHEVAKFLRGGLPVVENEPATQAWFAMQLAPATFGIFDVFPDEAGRKAHLGGQLAAALMAKAPELLSFEPTIENLDVLAAKLPGTAGKGADSAAATGSGKQANLQAQQRMGESVNSGKLDGLKDVMARDVVDHDPAPDQGPGPEGFIAFFTKFRSAFPDLAVAVDHMVADDNNVSIAYTITGTHSGDFQGIPATGRRINARGVQIARFENGKIVERWGSSDELGILRQIGAAPATNAPPSAERASAS